ncbi:hypothetical protein FHG87_003025 [Trinorchestia longiramus]|nr:hypothetical protein FHG87_003025 [Trinorchestia longiramus]
MGDPAIQIRQVLGDPVSWLTLAPPTPPVRVTTHPGVLLPWSTRVPIYSHQEEEKEEEEEEGEEEEEEEEEEEKYEEEEKEEEDIRV